MGKISKILCMLTVFSLVFSPLVYAVTSYEVEVSYNDEWFIINGEKFQAQTYCFNVEEGDMVIFLEGSAYGACASAKFLNLRTKQVCEVWCE